MKKLLHLLSCGMCCRKGQDLNHTFIGMVQEEYGEARLLRSLCFGNAQAGGHYFR